MGGGGGRGGGGGELGTRLQGLGLSFDRGYTVNPVNAVVGHEYDNTLSLSMGF